MLQIGQFGTDRPRVTGSADDELETSFDASFDFLHIFEKGAFVAISLFAKP